MKTKSPRRSSPAAEEHYRSLFTELSQSGQTVRSFATSRGLSAATLYAWRRRLGLANRRRPDPTGSDASLVTPRLLEVGLREVGGPRVGSGIVLYLFDRHRVEVPAGFAEEDLRRLVHVLAAC